MELAQLLKECKSQRITAQKYLYDRYAVSLFLVCRRYMRTDEQAEEMMMNGFLNIFNGLVKFDYHNESATLGWMKKIMVNECLQALRKKNSFLTIAEDEANSIAVDEEAISALTTAEIFTLVTQLPVGYRTVFNLYVIEGMNHREIASALDISEGTSKSQLSKARTLLQQLLIQSNASYADRKIR